MPNASGSVFKAAAEAIDLRNSLQLFRVARSKGVLGGMLGAFFRGADMTKVGQAMLSGGAEAMKQVPSSFGTGFGRVAATVGAGMLASAVLPRNDLVGGMGALAGFGAGYGAMGMIPGLPTGTGGGALRTIGGLVGGSIMWQGLRGPRMSDYA